MRLEKNAGSERDIPETLRNKRLIQLDIAGMIAGVRSGADGHTTGTPCDAHTYYARVRNDGAFDFEKELQHPASATQSRVDPTTAWPPDGEVPRIVIASGSGQACTQPPHPTH